MWPFGKRSEAPSDLRERVETLERQARALQTEWLDFEEKVQRKLWRDAKARDRAAPGPDDLVVHPEQPADPMTANLDPTSARIVLMRRRRVRPALGEGA
jgi:hypothetical protein